MPLTLVANSSSNIGLISGYKIILYKLSFITSSITLEELGRPRVRAWEQNSILLELQIRVTKVLLAFIYKVDKSQIGRFRYLPSLSSYTTYKPESV